MLTTTDPKDLIPELRSLADQLNDTMAIAEYIVHRSYGDLFGPGGKAKLLEPLIADTDPGKPENPILTVWNCLMDLKRDVMTTDATDLENQGGEIYDRLLRMAELLETAPA